MLGLVSPAQPNTSWLLLLSFRSGPKLQAYSIASSTRAASEAGAGGGKGEGRGGTGEEELGRGKKTERPAGQCMTSLPAGSEGAGWGHPWLPVPESKGEAELRDGGGTGTRASGGSFDSAVRYP